MMPFVRLMSRAGEQELLDVLKRSAKAGSFVNDDLPAPAPGVSVHGSRLPGLGGWRLPTPIPAILLVGRPTSWRAGWSRPMPAPPAAGGIVS